MGAGIYNIEPDVFYLPLNYHFIKMEMSNDLIKIIDIKFQHPAEIVIEHHKQIPICQIEHHNKTE